MAAASSVQMSMTPHSSTTQQSSSGSRICPLLASSSQAMAQVSDTWGPESHARKPNTLGSQPPTSSSYEQAGLLEKEAGLQSGAAGRLLPGGGQPRRRLSPQQRSYSIPGLCQSAAMLAPASYLLSLLLVMGTGGTMPSPQVPPQGCYMAEEAGERTFRCSQAGLTAVPTGIPNDTRKLYLDANRLASVPAGAFQHLPVLEELDLSHNVLAHLSGAAFQGLAGTLRHLDLSANQLASVPVEAFVGLQIQVNLSANPWRCDCALQEVLRQVRLAPGTGTGIVCGPGARPDLVGQEFLLLAGEEELCGAGRGGARRSTDVALLVTMGGWLALVVAYLAHYVWQNRDETRRPLKRAPVLPVRSEDSSTLSTMV
ncbi:leucine-rich repeat-containing protein 3C isoform X3 [Myotis myotis]|uniref:leucine-rich repeat-containing protein 3C isoform X3 n=1 Tax=Myotis myotis TaxID=51298 RepID=UPI00174C8780|nr:leucine-rich repeat-containing protein 3C isoform X3 [Myotis myotis]